VNNLELWGRVRAVPPEAKKEIQAGRLKGMTDINPIYRLKTLTEQFGPCGIGWWYEITDKHMERTDGGEVAAFVDINLYYTLDGVASRAVPGTGGSAFIAQEQKGLHVSDECYKMALTDAISVACKALGVGADVYWDKDKTKYSARGTETPDAGSPQHSSPKLEEAARQPAQPPPAPEQTPVTRSSLIADCKAACGLTDTQFDAIAARLRGKGEYVDKDIHEKVTVNGAMNKVELEAALAAIKSAATKK